MAPRTNPDSDDDSMDVFCCSCDNGVASLTIDTPTRNQVLPSPPSPPPTPTDPDKYQEFFQQWINSIQSYMKSVIVPQMIDVVVSQEIMAAFVTSLKAVIAAVQVQTDAERILQELQSAKDTLPAIIQEAQQSLKDAQQSVRASTETSQEIAIRTILQPLDKTFLSTSTSPNDFDDTTYLLYLILMPSNIPKFVAWCKSSETNATELISNLLAPNISLLRSMMESGGPNNGQYGRAIQIYYQIQSFLQHQEASDQSLLCSNSNDITLLLQRLQMAVALEHAEPIGYFGTPSQHVDPIKRYIHYRDAFLLNELDVHFIQFNVWELRQIINSDATDQELTWGRQSLMAYRPDLVLSNDPTWNYCMVVKTDVNYSTPDWYKSPRSYDQILSGGGKCGPRAWYGRFICKAFGIPTWGVRQPGHAAMTRWTTKGWDVCLGGGIWKSWWNDQCGLDFLLETQARTACAHELLMLQMVYRLQWLAQFYYNEKVDTVRRNGQCDPNSPWYTLSMIQRQRLAQDTGDTKLLMFPPHQDGKNQLERILSQKQMIVKTEVWYEEDTGAIIVPATYCRPTNKATSMPSFLGGQQLFVKDDAEIEYHIDQNFLKDCYQRRTIAESSTATYSLTCRVATAHRSEQNLSLLVNGVSTYEISMPYTMAVWGETAAVKIGFELSPGEAITLRFKRSQQIFGFAFKEFRLDPVTV